MLATVEARNTEMRLVLDSVGQGFLTADADGRVRGQHSAVVERWFGPLAEGVGLWAYLGAGDPDFAGWLALSWTALVDDVLPLELATDQLPKELVTPTGHFRLGYRPLLDRGALTGVVVVVTDVTTLVLAARSEALQRELTHVLDHALRDRAGVLQGLGETTRLVRRLTAACGEAMRVVHTIKGNAAMFGVQSVVQHCHELEATLRESSLPITGAQIVAVADAWHRVARPVLEVLDASTDVIELGLDEHRALLASIRRGDPHGQLSSQVEGLAHEPAGRILRRFGDQASTLARRLGKGEIACEVEHTTLRFDPQRYGGLWAAMVHAVRNAVDHGLEAPDERETVGKRRRGRLRFAARAHGGDVVIEMCDDGRGVRWSAVAARAAELGLVRTTRQDLTRALFSEGFSTRSEATEVSGRGLGLAALAAAAQQLGGRVQLVSSEGVGTTLRVIVPAAVALPRIAAVA